MATKRKNYDRLVNKMTKGLDLTARQKQTVKNQLMRGVDTPRLTIAGVKLTLEEIGTTQQLLREYKQAGRTRKDTGSPARLRWKGRDYATTSEGVVVTREEVKQLRSQIKKINRDIARRQFRDTALNVQASARNNTAETQFYPARAREQVARYRTFTLKGIHNQSDWERFKADIQSFTPRNNKPSEYIEHIYDVEKSNWIRSARKQWGRWATEIISVVSAFSSEDFHELIQKKLLPNVGDVYDALGADRIELRRTVLAALPEIEEVLKDIKRGIDPADVGL